MKHFEYTTLPELMADVREFIPSLDAFIDESKVIGKILWCNDKLGMPIRKINEDIIRVREFIAPLPTDFQKMIYVAALSHTSFGIAQFHDRLDNFVNMDEDVCTIEFKQGCDTFERRVIQKKHEGRVVHNYQNWTELSLSPSSYIHTSSTCVNKTLRGQYTIDISESEIETPFREGELYLMYYGFLQDEEGNIQLPLNALIYPWYKWCVIEEILIQVAMNSDADVANKLKLAQSERAKAWLDAFNFTTERTYQEVMDHQKKKELEMWNKYYKWVK